MKKELSWKFLLPIGLILHFVGGAIGVIGDIMLLLGIIDFLRQILKNKSKK